MQKTGDLGLGLYDCLGTQNCPLDRAVHCTGLGSGYLVAHRNVRGCSDTAAPTEHFVSCDCPVGKVEMVYER